MYIVLIFLLLIKTLKSIENDKKVTFGVKSFFFRKRDGFPLKNVDLRKTLKKGSFMHFWRKKYIIVKEG